MAASDTERWRAVFRRGPYQASDQGGVRSVRGSRVQVLRQRATPSGPAVLLSEGWGYFRRYCVAELVAAAFLGEPPTGMVVDYLDGDVTNVLLANLFWAAGSPSPCVVLDGGAVTLPDEGMS